MASPFTRRREGRSRDQEWSFTRNDALYREMGGALLQESEHVVNIKIGKTRCMGRIRRDGIDGKTPNTIVNCIRRVIEVDVRLVSRTEPAFRDGSLRRNFALTKSECTVDSDISTRPRDSCVVSVQM